MDRVREAILLALSKGYQIEPKAIELISSLERDPVELVSKAIEGKWEGYTIGEEEIRRLLGLREEIEEKADYEVVRDPSDSISTREGVEGFRSLFTSRYKKLMSIARQRRDASKAIKISKLKDGDLTAGLLMSKSIGNGKARFTIDDNTGSINLMAFNTKILKVISEAQLDQLLIVKVEWSKKGFAIAKDAYHPDVPDHLPSLPGKHVYLALLSDLHVGSKSFMKDAFYRLLDWLKSDEARRLRYVIIAGDLIDGIGIYPRQEEEIKEKSAKAQMDEFAKLVKSIPKGIETFVIPGNHDPVRQALPQPRIDQKYAGELYKMENIHMLGNPSWLRLHGVNVLVYHGQSLFDVIASTPGTSFSKPARAMKILLKARHLAPEYGARTPIAPEQEDLLVIDEIPDIIHSGHVHVLDVDEYKGVLLINSGTWQAQTSYQANMGINPTPCLMPVVDLATLELKIKDFR